MEDTKQNYKEAYEADLELRDKIRTETGSSEEINSTRQFLSVVMQELEETKQQLNLAVKNAEGIQLERERSKWFKNRSRLFKILAVSELIVLFAVVIGFIVYVSIQPSERAAIAPDGSQVSNNSFEVQSTNLASYIPNLRERVEATDFSVILPFEASVEDWYGYECLVFTYKSTKIYYQNEYDADEPRQSLIFKNTSKMLQLNWKYSLEGDLTLLCPEYGSFGEDDTMQMLFKSYNNEDRSGMPLSLRFVEEATLWSYETIELQNELEKAFQTTFSEEIIVGNDKSKARRMQFNIENAPYVYALTEADYTRGVYDEEYLIQFDEDFTLAQTEEGLVLNATLTLSENQYLGEVKAEIAKVGDTFTLKDVKYYAYANANQEDEANNGIMLPFANKPEKTLTIIGYLGERFMIPVSELSNKNPYNWEHLDQTDKNNWIYQMDQNNTSIRGIDVSKYQGKIDWKRVKEAGVEFAIIRLGFRGWGEGTLEIDPMFEENIKGANEAGIQVGVYYFSQAITKMEAVEEAEFVLDKIKSHKVTYPIIFDTERMTVSEARANNLSRQERTDLCIAFSERIKEANYIPMIYANTKYMVMGLDLERLNEYDKWYAYYGNNITLPYDFQMLQYSDTGTVPGISAPVDLNISFVDYSIK